MIMKLRDPGAFSVMALAGVCIFGLSAIAGARTPADSLAFGIDRSNMGTEWTIAPPQEPNISPFLTSEYNKPGDFEARRVAVLDGIARTRAGWFRDGFGGSDLSIDLLRLVHARGLKMLAIVGGAVSDYPPGAHLSKAQSGCPYGTYPLSSIDLGAYRRRLESQLKAVRAAGQTVDAFEIGNELDLYCNDADSPTGAEWAKHRYMWFLSPVQVRTFVRGYAPFLATSVAAIRTYFPQAPIITYGNSIPTSAPLMEALSSVRGANGTLTDYTKLVDGYGSHLYPISDTTLSMVRGATASLRYEAAHYPHIAQKPIWITEWNPADSSFWNNRPWYFQYDAMGRPGGALNKADSGGVYKAMDRAGAIRTFNRDVVASLRASSTDPVNISHVFYYAYDSGAKSPLCAHVTSGGSSLGGFCLDGVIDPATGDLLPSVAAAVAGATQ